RLADALRAARGGAGEPLETLVERHVDAVEVLRDLREWAVVERLRLPDPSPVGVQGYAEPPGRRGQLTELFPGRQQATGVTQRHLDENRAQPRPESAQVI